MLRLPSRTNVNSAQSYGRSIDFTKSICQMAKESRDSSESLLQISMTDEAIRNMGKTILKDYMKHCITEAVHDDDHGASNRLSKAINRFVH